MMMGSTKNGSCFFDFATSMFFSCEFDIVNQD